jgi:hypothetical protein
MSALPPKADMFGSIWDVRLAKSGHSEAGTLALEQAFCIYLDCRRSPLFLSVCDTPNSSKANKKERGAWTLLKLLCR